ncbi:MAG TPA: hypothetical protein VN667_06610 [Burkholderiales bacterium]|nr:hypothetical protein [Burkholderiales bacterium]
MPLDQPQQKPLLRMKEIHADQAEQVRAEMQRIEYLMGYAGRRLMNSYEVLQSMADGKDCGPTGATAKVDRAQRLENALEDALAALRSQHVAKQLAAQVARRVELLDRALGAERAED